MFSLESSCLNVVVENFEQFHFAFTVSTDARLQRNFDFLKRRYSNHLAKEVLAIHTDDRDDYLDFLINEYLTSFKIPCKLWNLRNFPSFDECYGDKILERISKCCPRIVEINATFANFTDKGIQFLCETKNGILPCPGLKNIKMAISEDDITDKGAEHLIRSLPLLERFSYPYLPRVLHSIHAQNSSASEIVHTFNLTELDLCYCKEMSNFTEIVKACLTVCPKLESITCCLKEKEQLDALCNSHLKELDLELSPRMSNINIDYFLKVSGCNLIDLKMLNCTVSASALAMHCPTLEKLLIVDVVFIDDDDVQPFFPSLTSCDFLEMSTIVKAFRLLSSSSPKLESVAFTSCVLCSEMKKQILMWCKSPAAKHISFYEMDLEIKFLRDILLNCCSLKCMSLIGCNYNVNNPYKKLNLLAESLPNKPSISYLIE